jgi:acetyl-CoA carboxylase beta subunit
MTENKNTIDDKTLEKYRRIEYGENYDYWFRKCENCSKTTYYRDLYFLNKSESIIVCLECYYNINYEDQVREMQRFYK